jgi:hypothetical protein
VRLLLEGLRRLAIGLLALLVLFEEWGWEPLQALMARIARLPAVAWVERRIAALPPYGALLLFGAFSLTLVPVKLLALWLIGQGRELLGLVIIVAAKLIGTAIVARLFTLTQPSLMRLPWFARVYGRWTLWKNALLARVRASWAWRVSRSIKRGLQRRWQRWRKA